MSRALYREYRPKSLEDVVGQEHITKTLKNAINKGSISHAYLFTGPKGVGKTSIARILAHEINDLEYNDEDNHLDIIEIDAASNRRIDEIRDLREKVHIAPTSSKYKVYIIDEVHMLTREAFNALLKTLEEPPEHAVFILATTESHKVPETITSRTQRYTFRPIEEAEILEHLKSIAKKEKINITDEAIGLLADHGRGSFRDSIGMLDQIAGVDTKQIDKTTVQVLLGVPSSENTDLLIEAIEQNDSDKLFSSIHRFKKAGSQPAIIAKSLISELRNQFIHKELIINPDKTVNLMKELLKITGVNSSYEALEIALLEALVIENNSGLNTNEIVTEKVNKTNQKVEVPSTVISPKKTEKSVNNESENIKNTPNSGDWQSVLDSIKGHHNTLYGLLRMANYQMEDDRIILTFKFEFHKKQLNTPKHMEILNRTVVNTYGNTHRIDIVTDKSINKSAKPGKYTTNDNLASVSNIFDGAELLES